MGKRALAVAGILVAACSESAPQATDAPETPPAAAVEAETAAAPEPAPPREPATRPPPPEPLAPGENERPRVLLLGLDGADWDVMDPLFEAGELPNLARLVNGGARALLDCAPAMPKTACFCPPVWVSIATGQPHSVHRISLVHAIVKERRAPALWLPLHREGGATTLISYRNTWEPEKSARYVATEYGLDVAADAHFQRLKGPELARAAWPDLLAKPSDLFESLGIMPYAGERPFAAPMVARDRIAMQTALELVAKDPTDLIVVLIHSIDKAGHLHWASVQPEPGDPIDTDAIRRQAAKWTGPVVAHKDGQATTVVSQYLETDAWLGELLARVAIDYVVIASDHGMTRNVNPKGLAGHHGPANPDAHDGILAVWGEGVKPGTTLDPKTVFDVAPLTAHLLGMPVAENLAGTVPTDAFEPEWLAAHPIETVESW